jgi:hypothetical protein
MAKEKIRAVFIFEIMGRPAEYIKEALDNFTNTLNNQNGVRIVSKKIHEPKTVEKSQNDLFTTFAEVEVEVDNIGLIFAITLNMLPSHVEIIDPEEIKINNLELGSVISDLSFKLHRFDEVTKGLTLERENLINRLKELNPNFKESISITEDKETKKKEKPVKKKSKKK